MEQRVTTKHLARDAGMGLPRRAISAVPNRRSFQRKISIEADEGARKGWGRPRKEGQLPLARFSNLIN